MEIMVVIAILAAMVVIAMPRLQKRSPNIKSVVRQLSVLSTEVRHYARLKNATYRIVFNLNGKEDSYFVEAANHEVLLKSGEDRKDASEDKEAASPFSKVDKPLKGERLLPDQFFFKSVQTKTNREPTTKGTAYIHYTPEGLVEEAIVQITNGKDLTWSLIFNPLTGHASPVPKAVNLQEIEIK